MFEYSRKSLTAAMAVFAALLMVCVGFAVASEQSEAKSFTDGDGSTGELAPTTVNIAPGFSYEYEIAFASSLNYGANVTVLVNGFELAETPIEVNDNLSKTATETSHDVWGTLTLQIPETCAPGQYDFVLKATHTASGQTAYQYIIFDVKSGVTFQPTTIGGTHIQNDTFTQEFTVTAGLGNIRELTVETDAFDVTSQQPTVGNDSQVETFTITGVPTTAGDKTITVSGSTSSGETFEKEYTFHVYTEFEGTYEADTITKIDGTQGTSDAETVPSDLDVTWTSAPSELPAGVSLNAETGVVTVQSDNYIGTTITLTATDDITGQTKTKQVVIQNEAVAVDLQLDTAQYLIDGTFWTYVNAGERTFTVSPTLVADTTFSGIASWDVTGDDTVVTVENGTVKITAPAAAAASAEYTVSAVTEFGKSIDVTFNLVVEGELTADAANKAITLINNATQKTVTQAITASAEYATLSYNVTASDEALTVNMAEGNTGVIFSSGTFDQSYTAQLVVTTLAGQEATVDFTVNTWSALSFNEPPTTGAWFGAE